MNSFSNKADGVLSEIATSAAAIVAANYEEYEVENGFALDFKSHATAFASTRALAKTAADAARQATQNKDASREALLAIMAQLSAVLYAPQSNVTDGELAAIGFSPRRSGTVRPLVAQPVRGLAAVPSADGSVALAWDRSGNSKSAIFRIEASADSGATWTIVGSTSRAKTTLDGFAPGVATWFRVTATTATTAARPSFPVAIYGPQPNARVELKVA